MLTIRTTATASMLIMLYASTKISGDATQAVEYVSSLLRLYSSEDRLTCTVRGREEVGRLPRAEHHDAEHERPVCAAPPFAIHVTHNCFRQPVDQEANNLVNLALKSIVAVKAMSEISRLAGQDSDASMYQVKCLVNCHGDL